MDESASDEKPAEANEKAIEYLQDINFQILGKTVFTDRLATVSISDEDREIGELTLSVEETTRGDEICYLIHAQSHGLVDNIPCGTSVTAYIGRGVKTLEQVQNEYMNIPDKPLSKKTVLTQDGQGDNYVIRRTVTEGTVVTEEEQHFSPRNMQGFVSEGANIIIQRIMAIRQEVPQGANFVALDSNLELANMSYEKCADVTQQVDDNILQAMTIKRHILAKPDKLSWVTHFLDDGHMASRETIGSQVRMQLVTMPQQEEVAKLPVPEKKDLNWREDMELLSHFLDRKEELINDHQTYVQHKPELRAVIEDFCQFVLLRKPDDIVRFAAEYFAPLSSGPLPSSQVQTLNGTPDQIIA